MSTGNGRGRVIKSRFWTIPLRHMPLNIPIYDGAQPVSISAVEHRPFKPSPDASREAYRGPTPDLPNNSSTIVEEGEQWQ
jgi:hypothetical protein